MIAEKLNEYVCRYGISANCLSQVKVMSYEDFVVNYGYCDDIPLDLDKNQTAVAVRNYDGQSFRMVKIADMNDAMSVERACASIVACLSAMQ